MYTLYLNSDEAKLVRAALILQAKKTAANSGEFPVIAALVKAAEQLDSELYPKPEDK